MKWYSTDSFLLRDLFTKICTQKSEKRVTAFWCFFFFFLSSSTDFSNVKLPLSGNQKRFEEDTSYRVPTRKFERIWQRKSIRNARMSFNVLKPGAIFQMFDRVKFVETNLTTRSLLRMPPQQTHLRINEIETNLRYFFNQMRFFYWWWLERMGK